MNDKLNLKQDEHGNTVVVTSEVVEQTAPFGSDEIIRQIKQHTDIVEGLQRQLQAVQAFEASGKKTLTAVVSDVIATPIIDQEALTSVTEV